MSRSFLLLILLATGCVGTAEDVKVDGTIGDVRVETSDGVTIAGTYYRAEEEHAPGVILLHMLSRNRGDLDEFAEALQASGYAVLSIDLRGHGDSDFDWKKFTDADFKDMVRDVAAAKEFLVKEGVNKSSIGIIGASVGANIALNYAAGDEEIRAVVLLSPGIEYRGVRTDEVMVEYGARPLLIVVGDRDGYSTESSNELYFYLATEKTEFRSYPTSAHGTQILAQEGSSSMIIDWLKEAL